MPYPPESLCSSCTETCAVNRVLYSLVIEIIDDDFDLAQKLKDGKITEIHMQRLLADNRQKMITVANELLGQASQNDCPNIERIQAKVELINKGQE